MNTITLSTPRWAVVTGYVAGILLAVVPALVELVEGDFFLLLPVALVLALVVARPLRGGVAHRVFAWALGLAIVVELLEQFLFSGDVPAWADVPPPLLFTVSGVALVLAARERSAEGLPGS